MGDRSQDQEMKDMGGDGQQTQAGRDAIALQNSQMTINRSFISLFGDRMTAPDVDWKLAKTILKDQQATIETRLRDSLFGLAEVDAVEVKAKRQEESSALALESVKSLSIDGIEVGTIDSQAPIISTYARKDIQGKLLILGTPGAGKTITLLKLAEQLVDEAIENPETIIPVIFELSTWRDGQSIEDWLIEQLYDLYGGKRERQVYETWLEQRALLPLLDGLDELGMVRQKACTEKVNEFAKIYPQVVVCCRVKEFQQVGVNLSNLRGKVQLQPLSDRQLELYLQQMGKTGLWGQIQTVPEMGRLLEPVIDKENADYDEPGLLRVPLFISLAAQVYERDKPLKGKADLFDRYIDRQLSWDVRVGDRDRKEFKGRSWAFKRLEREADRREVRNSLKWLAWQLNQHNQVELLIERIEIDWLKIQRTKWQYHVIFSFIFSSIFSSIFGLIVSLIFGLIVGLILSLVFGLIFSLIFSIVLCLIGTLDHVEPVESFRVSISHETRKEIAKIIRKALLSGLVVGMAVGMIFGIIIGLWFSMMINTLHAGLMFGLMFGYFFGIPSSLISCLIFGLIGGLIGSLKQDLVTRSKPNQGIWNSLISVLCTTIIFSCLLGLIVPLVIFISPRIAESGLQLLLVLFVWVTLLVIFLYGGGIACIQHFSLRTILTCQYKIPWNLARFLTYCHERRLLQQIGGRYRFIHRELLEHFAGMENGEL